MRTAHAHQLLLVSLANYTAGALLVLYARFREEAGNLRHDIDRLRQSFGVSFEQAYQRLSTLPSRYGRQRLQTAQRLPFPIRSLPRSVSALDRASGYWYGWPKHPTASATSRQPKGCSNHQEVTSGPPDRYAVVLGDEIEHAHEFIYAGGLDLTSPHAETPISASCGICPHPDCGQRAFPPSDDAITADPDKRDVVPYIFEILTFP